MQLNQQSLNQLPSEMTRPNNNVNQAKIGILHLGLGNFFRAHQCAFTQHSVAQTGDDWAYVAATMSSPRVINALKEQDFLYTHIAHSNKKTKAEIIHIIKDVVLIKDEIARFFEYIQDENIVIISLTITEKGYYYEGATGNLLVDHPDIQADLQNNQQPKTAIGALVLGLQKRKATSGKGLTILSCDNLPNNGEVTQKVILQYAAQIDTDLKNWISQNITFPSSMVDRITPHVTDNDLNWVKENYGYDDAIPIQTEDFSQWVIEDNFIHGRPKWELAGVEMVKDVHAFEDMKLRLLNGTHSTMAYLGYLADFKVIDAVIGNAVFAQFIRDMMDKEITPTLDMPSEVDITAYKDALIQRYKNPNLKHSTYQIAMDGSQKIPQRIMNSLKHQYQTGGNYQRLITALAGWIYYIGAAADPNADYQVQDPMKNEFARLANAADNDAEFVQNILFVQKIFGDYFVQHPDLVQQITLRHGLLKSKDILAVLDDMNKGEI